METENAPRSFFEFVLSQRGNTSSLEHARRIFMHQARMEQRPWCMTKREYRAELLRQQGRLKPGESESFPCEVCKEAGHYCPASRYGFEQEGIREHWCVACYAGLKCIPGSGTIDMGGKSKARKKRMMPCTI